MGAIIGTNTPENPITETRIAALPADRQSEWRTYLTRSQQQMAQDREYFHNEMKAHKILRPTIPPSAHNTKGIPLTEPASYYSGATGLHIADIIVSFQTPAGGWSKNLDMTRHLRAPGESYGTDNNSKFLNPGDFDKPADPAWHYIGTFDNDATITQLRFLARVINAAHGTNTLFLKSFLHGLDYVLASQYPSGGWPQVWPLEGGYHDAITLNDGAMLHVLQLMADVSENTEYSFVPKDYRTRCKASFQNGMECLFKSQIVVDGKKTVWCQQYDPMTLEPASARNYEMPSKSSSESAEIILFFMLMPDPSPKVVSSVHAAAEWFRKVEIKGKAYKSTGISGRHLIDAPADTLIWSRYYDIATDHPIFGDRDRTIHDTVEELSKERRKGYGWYRDTPKRLLEHYTRWSKEHPQR